MSVVQVAVIIIDLVGITIGIGAVLMAWNLQKTIGGRVGKAVSYFTFGVSWMITSFVYTIFNVRLDTPIKGALSVFGTDIHHGLMVLGMIFFILSARHFLRLAK